MERFIDSLVCIDKAVFLPITIIGIIGIVIGLSAKSRKHNAVLFCLILLILSWGAERVAIRIGSSRYAAILAWLWCFPAIYGIYAWRVPLWLKRSLLCGLLLVCVIKQIRSNPYDDYLLNAADAIRNDQKKTAPHSALIFSFSSNGSRLGYYAKTESVFFHPGILLLPGMEELEDFMSFNQYRYGADVVYLAYNVTKAEIPKTYPARYELIFESYSNRRASRVFLLFRYAVPRLRPGGTAFPTSGAPYPYGDFEHVASEATTRLFIPELRKNQVKFFAGEVVWPEGWRIIGKVPVGAEIEAEQAAGEGIGNSAALKLKSVDSPLWVWGVSRLHSERDRILEFSVRGTPGSEFSMGYMRYDSKGKSLGIRHAIRIVLSDGDWSCYQVPLGSGEDISDGVELVPFFNLLHGDIRVDNLNLKRRNAE